MSSLIPDGLLGAPRPIGLGPRRVGAVHRRNDDARLLRPQRRPPQIILRALARELRRLLLGRTHGEPRAPVGLRQFPLQRETPLASASGLITQHSPSQLIRKQTPRRGRRPGRARFLSFLGSGTEYTWSDVSRAARAWRDAILVSAASRAWHHSPSIWEGNFSCVFKVKPFTSFGPLSGPAWRRWVPTPFADPLLHVAVPAEAVVGLAVLFRGAFRPYAALLHFHTFAALLYWFFALALLFCRPWTAAGACPTHSFFLCSDARSDAVMLAVVVQAQRLMQ